jgi:RNA polymerase sigma factor (sigma-70 family)
MLMDHDARGATGQRTGPTAVRMVTARRARYRSPEFPPLPLIGADDIVLPVFDDRLGEVARRAKAGDAVARDALYVAFEPKLHRMSFAVRTPFAPLGSQAMWDRDDVAQEGYLVFVELIDTWPEDHSFTAYVMSRFQWRLRDVIQRGVGRASVPPRQHEVPIEGVERLPGTAPAPVEPSPLMDALVAALPPPLDAVLIAHVVHGKTRREIADAMGISRRTMVRYWTEIRQHADLLIAHRPDLIANRPDTPDTVQ